MNKTIVSILLALLIFLSCNHHDRNSIQKGEDSNELEITTLVFDASVYSDTTYKEMLLEERPIGINFGWKGRIKLSKKDQKKFNLETDSLRNELDTAQLYVLITDSLLEVHANYLQSKPENIKSIEDGINNATLLSAWKKEIVINRKAGRFDLKNLLSKYHYKYLLQSQFRRPKGDVFIAGTFSMSPIFFNKKRDKAFVYSTFVCGSLCGEGRDIYLAKIKGKWEIVGRVSDWVS
jgi:hypothetical protein